ncbi:hypothetical protein JCM18237_28190 [Halorubrum luteum]
MNRARLCPLAPEVKAANCPCRNNRVDVVDELTLSVSETLSDKRNNLGLSHMLLPQIATTLRLASESLRRVAENESVGAHIKVNREVPQ